ncbi:aldolase [Paenarthrobacter ureafaciens]|jgi:sulfofructosephosphate aldolase|uniref:aldolase n=1 Tax=Paenarthrobacter ureafaciens TaxID=37931 RepID=UPI00140A815B|nr:aldolase [Paenarthrobacter ureafaciens]MCX8453473.1 aldolase [Paenarthrobacter ureafaciens]MCY0973132.1 aldolase [Paenarthrobacter ureafaciens]QQQ63971.1 aldolase [Paenarthrobacter ureafaciens]UOD82926.1 aldolase [Paenarthrobacter ureafaciens]WNZ02633.1 aldolase [Paenarthrobacter ureafaciens]
MSTTDLSTLQRPSGAFAMLAVDQREAMRNMFAEHTDEPVTDEDLRDFKLAAARILTPYASGVLIDRQFALDQAIEAKVVDPGCGLIASADHFESAHDELVGEVTIDKLVDPGKYAALGAKALKLLVLYRPDEPAEGRVEMVREFVDSCKSAGLISIIEPVSRKPLAGGDFDWNAGILAAAKELGSLGADLYKAEVPFKGQAPEAEVRAACAELSKAIDGPWVVLSSGVPEDVFPEAVRWACLEGASGFLAGRAVWASCIGSPDVIESLSTDAVQRLQRLCAVVDEVVTAQRTNA